MERRIAAVIRWLERCLAACRKGSLESVLMDAECARADLERLREDVWAALEKKSLEKREGKRAFRARIGFLPPLLRGAVLALIAVMAVAAPLAVPLAPLPGKQAVVADAGISLEWVTPDEKMLLGNLRRRLSENSSFAVVPDREDAGGGNDPAVPSPARKTVAERPRILPPGASGRQDSAVIKSDGGVPYDRMIDLLQTGERALKNERPVIKIER